eukprot:UN24565
MAETKSETSGAGNVMQWTGPVEEMVDSLVKRLDNFEATSNLLKQAENATGQKPKLIVGGALLGLVSLLFLFFGFDSIVPLVAWVYPMYRSSQAVRTQSTNSERWLIYWIVYGLTSLFFWLVGSIIGMIVPAFGLVKCGFYVFLWHDKTKGAQLIFNQYLRPGLEKQN